MVDDQVSDGDDLVSGSGGDETLTGGLGTDVVHGNRGSDTYVFYDGNSDGDLSDTGTDYLVKLSGVGLNGIAYTDIA